LQDAKLGRLLNELSIECVSGGTKEKKRKLICGKSRDFAKKIQTYDRPVAVNCFLLAYLDDYCIEESIINTDV
jgi:hypothetical protein